MTERARVSVATHYVRYALGNVLVMVAGFVSFPIMTRLLDTGQYGILGYYDAWLLILAGLFKLGAQHTILRFYPHAGGAPALARFGANSSCCHSSPAPSCGCWQSPPMASSSTSSPRKPRRSAGSC